MTATYFAIATDVGNAKDANAKALGLPRKYVALAIGDGGGDNAPVPTPKTSQKALLGEWRRAPLNSLDTDQKNPAQLIAEQVIPENVGGKWIRELGLFDEDGDLCYVSNAPPTYKPTLPEGSGKTQSVRMVLINSSGVNVELKIDPGVILATRDYADKAVAASMKAHTDADDPHLQYYKKTGGVIAGSVMVGDDTIDKSLTMLKVFGRVRGVSAYGALTAANGGGTGQTSMFLTRDGAPANYNTWEMLHAGDGAYAVRLVSADYAKVTPVYAVSLNADGVPTSTRLMERGGRVLLNGAADDGATALQVKGGAKFDTPAAGDSSRSGATTEFVSTTLKGFPPVCSIVALPASNIGPIIVAEVAEVWVWSATQYYTGYRSPLCGRPLDGHTLVPLPSEIDAVGGTLSKSAYASLWAYAQENALVVPSASWAAGTHRFVDLGGDNFRAPDLRNQFRRYSGTDADTANARTLGSGQVDQLRSHRHATLGTPPGSISQSGSRAYLPATGSSGVGPFSGGDTTESGGTETRPINTAYAPRIHI